MKNLFLFSLCFLMLGCSTPTLQQKSAIPLPQTQASKTSLFYYIVNEERPAQAAGFVQGKFTWKDGCIYLVNSKGEYNTAMFPMYPKSETHWDESTKTITLHGIPFKIGDSISTNGMYSEYVPNTEIAKLYESQGDKRCLTPTLAQIGTISINTK